MEAISKTSGSASSVNENDRQKKFVEVVNDWLDNIHRHVRQHKQQQPMNGASTTPSSMSAAKGELETIQRHVEKDGSRPIPYSIFLYLWEMQQQHKRVTVRRSALFLSGLLLLRSKDCRFHLDQETNLAEWVSSISVKIDGSGLRDGDHDSLEASGTNSNRKSIQLALLQKEAIALISLLVDKGFDKMYAKLTVAARSLRHRCTTSLLETSDSVTSTITPLGMANWRRLRDLALLHGEKEIQKVRKLLDRADTCLETLVPRIDGIRQSSPSSTSSQLKSVSGKNHSSIDSSHGGSDGNINTNGDSSESDDDDIDWEDGDEVAKPSANPAHNQQDLHVSAVEQTMAAMEKTSGNTLFSGGQLEIDFDRQLDDEAYRSSRLRSGSDALLTEEIKARGKLKKIVPKLSNRHLVRLSAWLDGLRNADNLIRGESASLVSLSRADDNLRLEMINRLSLLRQDVSTVISSASRLNIKVHQGAVEAHAHFARGNDSMPLEAVQASAERVTMRNNRIPKRKTKQHRVRRIKISYKK